MRLTNLLILIILSSCSEIKEKQKNELIVINKKDTVETGYWQQENNNIKKIGHFEDGFRIGYWVYFDKQSDHVDTIKWEILTNTKVSINYPSEFEIIERNDKIILFQLDIPDDDSNTFIALLGQRKKEINIPSSKEYLKQLNLRRINSNNLIEKEAIQYTLKDFLVFKYEYSEDLDSETYKVVSFIFETDNTIYELAYKNLNYEFDQLESELLLDMLYSIKTNGQDIFNFNNFHLMKVDSIRFEDDLNNRIIES